MADENTPNPANPNPPTGDADTAPPPAEKVSSPSETPETQPAAEAEGRDALQYVSPISKPAEIPSEEVVDVLTEEVAKTETAETISEVQPATEAAAAQPEKTEEVPTETPAKKVVETIPQPEAEVQPEQPEITEEEVIQGAPSKPGDKIETAFPPSLPPTAEPILETPLSKTAAEDIPPKTKKSAQPKSGFKPDGITPLDGEEKIFAAVGYVGILALLPLLARRDSEFAQHHGRQGLVVAIIFIVLWLFAKLGGTLSTLVFVLQFAAIVGGFVLAYKGDWFRIPGIYDLSLKIKLNPSSSRTFSNETQNSEVVETPPQNSEKEAPPPSQN